MAANTGIQTSSRATAGNITRHETKYRLAAQSVKTYDQLAEPVRDTFEPRGSTTQVAWPMEMTPRPTGAVGSETSDFTPQYFTDATGSFSLSYYADGLKAHDLVRLKSSLNPWDLAPRLVGQNAMETIDSLARRVSTEGDFVIYGDGTHTTRITLDLGTAGDRMNFARLSEVKSIRGSWAKGDVSLMAIMDDFVFEDLILGSGSGLNVGVQLRASYTENGQRILFNYELGQLANVRLLVSPYAKAFYGAGADNGSAVATTLSAAASMGDKTITVASATNISVSKWLTIGTVQTTTEADTNIETEIVRVASVSGTTVTIMGKGANGGLKYNHANAAAVENGDTVHCVILGHNQSIAVDWSEFGRMGKLVEPFQDGNARQWTSWAWKAFIGYGRLNETELHRIEVSASGQ